MQIVFRKSPVPQKVDDGLNTTNEEETASKRRTPKKELEHGLVLGQSVLPIPLGHRQLVKIRNQAGTRHDCSVVKRHRSSPITYRRFRKKDKTSRMILSIPKPA
jgi:hypothetical protein